MNKKKIKCSLAGKITFNFTFLIAVMCASVVGVSYMLLKNILSGVKIEPVILTGVNSVFILTGALTAGGAVIVSFFISYYIAKSITEPLVELGKKVKDVERGKFDAFAAAGRIKPGNEIDSLAEAFARMTKNMLAYRKKAEINTKKLEAEVEKKTRELSRALNIACTKQKRIEKQRADTLNILEDVTDSQRELRKLNKELERRSFELGSLNLLSDKLSGAVEVSEAINIAAGQIRKFLDYSIITFLLDNFEESGNIIFHSYLKESVGEGVLYSVNNEIRHFFAGKEGKEFLQLNEILKNLKPRISGAALDDSKGNRLASSFILPLIINKKIVGALHIGSTKHNLYHRGRDYEFIRAIANALTVAVARLQTLAKLQHSKTESLVHSLSNGIIMLNMERRVILVNPAAGRIIGRDKNNLSGLSGMILGIDEIIKKVLASGEDASLHEVEIGGRIYEIRVASVRDYSGYIVGAAVIFYDITRIMEIDRMKTEFVSVASHQLRTPLTAVKLFTEMLIKGEVGGINDSQKDYLSNIFQSTERMVRLINDLLNISRIESGRLRVEPEPVRPDDLIKNVLNESKPLADLKKVSVAFIRGKERLPKVMLDKSLFRQVVHNLVVNAIRYSLPGKGKVRVELKHYGSREYLISVSDNGIGIPARDKEKIFKKFFRADNAIKKETEGTGLGLYVSKMVVKSSGGRIWFESKKGRGTTFFVAMPLSGMKPKRGERGLMLS